MNYNLSIIGGRLVRDPELRYTPSGAPVCKFTVASGRKFKTEAGEEKEETLFIDVVAWNRQAELVGQYLRKGSALLVEGRLKLESWEDRQTGEKRTKIVLVLRGMQFVGGKKEGEGGAAPAPAPRRPAAGAAPAAASDADGPPPEDDDVPF